MSQKKANQLTLEVRRIRSSARAGFIDDYGNCSKTLSTAFWTSLGGVQKVVDEAGNETIVTR